jgi:predicted DCC family thiol-disulfide oxidoreductase YuxK
MRGTPRERETATRSSDPGAGQPIVFFDGVCGLCNRLVDVLLRADRGARLRFAPLQGETARALLPPRPADAAEWSIVYLDERGLHERTDAVLRLGRRLGGVWRLVTVLRLMPPPIRDGLYRVIARNRYQWFGRRGACRIPSADERRRFLP